MYREQQPSILGIGVLIFIFLNIWQNFEFQIKIAKFITNYKINDFELSDADVSISKSNSVFKSSIAVHID